MIQKRVRKEGSSSIEDSNVFEEVLGDLDCTVILHGCLKNLETRVTEISALANTINENKIKGARQLEDLTGALDFIRKKFEDYKKERIENDEVIKSLQQGQASAFHNIWKIQRLKFEQYSLRNCLLIHSTSENKARDTAELVIKTLKYDMNIDMKIELINRMLRIGSFKNGDNRKSRPIIVKFVQCVNRHNVLLQK